MSLGVYITYKGDPPIGILEIVAEMLDAWYTEDKEPRSEEARSEEGFLKVEEQERGEREGSE